MLHAPLSPDLDTPLAKEKGTLAPHDTRGDDALFMESGTRLLRAFLDIDPGMSLNAILCLLMIRKANARKTPITSQDLSQELLIAPPTMTRLLTYLGDGKADEGFNGLALIRIDIDKVDRRRRILSFTNKGWRAMRKVIQQARKQDEP